MKAIVAHSYGPPDVLKYEEVEKPVAGDDEVLIRVRAASLNPLDWRLLRGKPYFLRVMVGLRRPKEARPGRDVAGEVEAVGRNVTRFKPGDEVFGACRGAFAEYACARESALVRKPENVTFEQAASVPVAGLSALQGLRDKGRIRPGQKVLINGAAGGVGTFSVQIAKSFGADVTGVCSTRNVEMVRSIGADAAVDYTREDFTAGAERYDLILDCVGHPSLSALRRVLTRDGTCVIVGAPHRPSLVLLLAHVIKPLVLSPFVSQKFAILMAKLKKEDLTVLGELMEAGKVTPVIERRYELSEVVEAVRHVEKGHARGKVVITMGRTDET
ncbi:MAG TPA: NAD(P)-dependent alcohol dehydrogenase [Pyrinomonadaceae bacterium]|jgi:NADPH:quinone reductase-like Zn-dependent oxidoreductase